MYNLVLYYFILFRHYLALRQNPKGAIKLPDTSIVLSSPTNETVVAGVYLRLFNNNPGWNVRRPKEFLSELLDTCISSMTKEKVIYLYLFKCM
jgi:DnaJ homolog subfamily C member 13